MIDMVSGFVGGMGMFFIGLKMTGDSVRSVAGRRFRANMRRWTGSVPSGALLGFVSGMLFQSTSGLSLLLASLIGVGATTVASSLPVLVGANAGVASLVLMAVVDIKVLIFFMVGLSGLAVAFERPARYVKGAEVMFGVGLLLLGLHTVRMSAAPLAQTPWFQHLLSGPGIPLLGYFVVGAVACFLLQTAAGVSILAITLAPSGLISGESALVVIYGSLLGSSLLSRFYAIQLTGARKRLVMGQVFFNLVGLAIFLPLLLFEHISGIPILLGGAALFFDNLPGQLTFLRIFFDCFTALVLLVFMPVYLRLLDRQFPDESDALQPLSSIRELSDLSPDTALLVISTAQGKLAKRLPGYVTLLRASLDTAAPLKPKALHQGIESQGREIDEGLYDIAETVETPRQAEAVAAVQSTQSLFRAVNTALNDMIVVIASVKDSPFLSRPARSVMEALDLLLLTLADAFENPAGEDLGELLELTRDSGPAMQQLRAKYLAEDQTASAHERRHLLQLTSTFERLVWPLRHIALSQQNVLALLHQDQNPQAGPQEKTAPDEAE